MRLKLGFRCPLRFLNIALDCVRGHVSNGSIELKEQKEKPARVNFIPDLQGGVFMTLHPSKVIKPEESQSKESNFNIFLPRISEIICAIDLY